jgi:tetratricopeptide (TPR) repeat protein
MLCRLCFWVVLCFSVGAWAQQGSSPPPANQAPPSSSQTNSGAADSSGSHSSSANDGATKPVKQAPDLSPPRSDRVNANDLGKDIGESSSKDTQIDLSPPANDAKAHPQSSDAVAEAEGRDAGGGVSEFHAWDPHKAAKDVEIGDFYFKRKNYRAAEDRYREALLYKDNDAIATMRLAVCLEKLDRSGEAVTEYQSYLKIMPHGPQSEEARKAIERINGAAAKAEQAK